MPGLPLFGRASRGRQGRVGRGLAGSGRVSLRPRIRHILGRLAANSAMVSVRVDGGDRLYHSALLAVEPSGKHLELDELTPEVGHRNVEVGSRLEVEGRAAGAIVRFETRVVAIEERSGIAFYRTRLPPEIVHEQKRGSYRARSTAGTSVAVLLGDPGLSEVDAVLCDISLGGLSVRIDRGHRMTLQRGDRIRRCSVRLPDGPPIESVLEIRHVEQDRAGPSPGWRLGGRFVDLDRRHVGAIQRLVSRLDREHAKMRASEEASLSD